MQSCLSPNSADSLQLSFDRALRALQFTGNFAVRGPLKLEQHDLLHRFVRYRVEQLGTTFRDFRQLIGWRLFGTDRVDPSLAKLGKRRFTTYGSSASLLTIGLPLLCGDFPRRDDGQQTP